MSRHETCRRCPGVPCFGSRSFSSPSCAAVGLGSASADSAKRLRHASRRADVLRQRATGRCPRFTPSVPSTLRWTSSGPAFLIASDAALIGGSVNSQARSGATYFPAATHQTRGEGVRAPGRSGSCRGSSAHGLSAADSSASAATATASCRRSRPAAAPTLVWTNSGEVFRHRQRPFMARGQAPGQARERAEWPPACHTFDGQRDGHVDDRLEALSGGATLRS